MTDINTAELRRLAEAATPVHDAPGYAVSEDGSIWSLASNWRGYGPRRLSTTEGKSGYLKIRMNIRGRRVNRMVHRIVAEAFLPPRQEGAQVRHKDGDKLNNQASNLQWGTARDNARDRDQHGTTARGERNGWSAIDEGKVREVRILRASGLTYREIERITGVGRTHARQIATRRLWAHVD